MRKTLLQAEDDQSVLFSENWDDDENVWFECRLGEPFEPISSVWNNTVVGSKWSKKGIWRKIDEDDSDSSAKDKFGYPEEEGTI